MTEEKQFQDIAAEAAACLKPDLFEPALRKVTDDLYDRLLTSVQDYLIDNAQWNIREQIEVHKRAAYSTGQKLVAAEKLNEALTGTLRRIAAWTDIDCDFDAFDARQLAREALARGEAA